MEMSFPHPRRGTGLAQPASGFAVLVASAVARQLAASKVQPAACEASRSAFDSDPVQARISYFGNRDVRFQSKAGGAFLPRKAEISHLVNNDEIAVYPDASADGKTKVLENALSKESAAMRGMED